MPPSSLLAVSAALLLLLAANAAASFCSAPGFAIEFAEDFDQPALNLSRWNVVIGTSPHPMIDDCFGDQCPPWSGCRAGLCLASNVYLENGTFLVLRSDAVPPPAAGGNVTFTTAAVTTRGKANWTWLDGTYRLCTRARMPGGGKGTGHGLWPAHWTLPDTDDACDPDRGEIDLTEYMNDRSRLYQSYWWQSAYPLRNCTNPKNGSVRDHKVVLPDNAAEFHEYAFEAGAEHIAFALDGVVTANFSAAENRAVFYDVRQYLLLNTAIGGEAVPRPTLETGWPAYHVIDYVRVAREQRR